MTLSVAISKTLSSQHFSLHMILWKWLAQIKIFRIIFSYYGPQLISQSQLLLPLSILSLTISIKSRVCSLSK